MGFLGNIGLISDIITVAQGGIPFDSLFRLVPRLFKKKTLTKAQLRKLMMMRRRMFVDTVIMHHKRLHDANREQVIEDTKKRIAIKAKTGLKPKASPRSSPSLARSISNQENRWREKTRPNSQSGQTHIKGLIDKERQKSRSKWTSRTRSDGSSQSI